MKGRALVADDQGHVHRVLMERRRRAPRVAARQMEDPDVLQHDRDDDVIHRPRRRPRAGVAVAATDQPYDQHSGDERLPHGYVIVAPPTIQRLWTELAAAATLFRFAQAGDGVR